MTASKLYQLHELLIVNQRPLNYPRPPAMQLKATLWPRSVDDLGKPIPIRAFPGRTYAVAGAVKPFLARFQRELRLPLTIERVGKCHRVIVFDVIVYEVDFGERHIRAGQRCVDGEIRWITDAVEVFRPLRTEVVIAILAEHWNFAPDDVAVRECFIRTSWQFVWRMPRFQTLRRDLLPRALAIPKPLMWLALQARIPGAPANSIVTNRMLNAVWEHRAAFARLARENHQLMPMMLVALMSGLYFSHGDAAQQLKHLFAKFGLDQRAWRFVVHYGTRGLRPIVVASGLQSAWEPIVSYLRFVADAIDRPPPGRFVGLWIELERECIVENDEPDEPVMPRSVRALAIEAARNAHGPAFEEFESQLFSVAEHYGEGDGARNKIGNATWELLVRRARGWQARRTALLEASLQRWQSFVGDCRIGSCEITPLTSAADILRVGYELHNCLVKRYESYTDQDHIRLFRIADTGSGRHRALVCLTYEDSCDEWQVLRVARFANRPAMPHQLAAAERLARQYTHASRVQRSERVYRLVRGLRSNKSAKASGWNAALEGLQIGARRASRSQCQRCLLVQLCPLSASDKPRSRKAWYAV